MSKACASPANASGIAPPMAAAAAATADSCSAVRSFFDPALRPPVFRPSAMPSISLNHLTHWIEIEALPPAFPAVWSAIARLQRLQRLQTTSCNLGNLRYGLGLQGCSTL